jgi:protoporphyrinogen oxidase
MDKHKVIIIGAGPAGLTAAYELLKKSDVKPIILEESEFVGGISRTVKYNGNRMDLGGHRFFTKNEQVMKIWKELMPVQGYPSEDDKMLNRTLEWCENGPNPETEDRTLLIRNRVSRIYYLKKFFDYPITLKVETFTNIGLVRTIRVGLGYIASLLLKRKEKSLEDFYINHFGKPLYEMFFEGYTEKVWGVHPSNIAPDWGAQRIKGLSLLKVITSLFTKNFTSNMNKETSLIEQFYYPKYGPGQLWEIMAEEIMKMGGQIILNTAVKEVCFPNCETANIQAVDKNGEIINFTAESIFSSMPIKDLIDGMGCFPPKEVLKIATNLPYRDFITVGLLLKKLSIVNNTKIKTVSSIVPDCWVYIQEGNVKVGRMQIFNNWSPYLVKNLVDTVWIGLEYFCNEDDEKWNMEEEKFIDYAVNEMEKIGILYREDILDSTLIKVKKAYPAYFGTYKDFNTVKDYLHSINNLYCIGRNGQHRYNNMDHSMLTAIEAVKCYIHNYDKSIIWNVNTEEEYHEKMQNH